MKGTLNTCNAKVFHSRQNTENIVKINVGTKTSKTKVTSERNVKKIAHCVSNANARLRGAKNFFFGLHTYVFLLIICKSFFSEFF